MARKAGQGKEEEESRARQQKEKTPVRDEEKTPARDGRGHHVVEQDAERPMWLPEHCMHAVDAPAGTKDHADDPDSANIGTGTMDKFIGMHNIQATVAAITTSATAATAAGIAVSQNVHTVTTLNKLTERVSSGLDLQNQINGHLHFGLLTLNQQMVLVQEQVDTL
ncbi:hypothetical protein STEG23_015551 [Scotinomys teguina]